jgi:endonuclease III
LGDADLDAVPLLREFYGAVHRPPANLFQFVVWEVLSEHASTARRDLAWNALRRIPALTPDAMFRAPAKALAEAVALTGAPQEPTLDRLRAIVDAFKRRRETFDAATWPKQNALAATRMLSAIPGIDEAIRRRALLFAVGLPIMPPDDEVSRVVCRLTQPIDLAVATPTRSPVRVRRSARRWLTLRLPPNHDAYCEAVTYLRHHARHTCLAVGPHCQVCPLATRCRSKGHTGGNPPAHRG